MYGLLFHASVFSALSVDVVVVSDFQVWPFTLSFTFTLHVVYNCTHLHEWCTIIQYCTLNPKEKPKEREKDLRYLFSFLESSYSPTTTLTKKTFNELHEQISLNEKCKRP